MALVTFVDSLPFTAFGFGCSSFTSFAITTTTLHRPFALIDAELSRSHPFLYQPLLSRRFSILGSTTEQQQTQTHTHCRHNAIE